MENIREVTNVIDGFLRDLEALANRARKEYELTQDVNVERENFDRLENKIHNSSSKASHKRRLSGFTTSYIPVRLVLA